VRIGVGSGNPAKVEPVREVAEALFPGAEVFAREVGSGVREQPLSEQETLRGALNRARGIVKADEAVLGVGIEGGIASVGGVHFGFTWVAVVDREGRTGLGSSARFEIPDRIAREVLAGRPLGEVVAELSGRPGIAREEGAMGLLSGGHVTRRSATVQALHFAFARFAGGRELWGE
jgi:inosine/xanthosine triphosphatase